jgi:CPA1 family monovalent cation:H+ antiporter
LTAFETILVLLFASAGLAVLGRRISLPPPLMIVIGGVIIALIPGLPRVEIDPDLAFTIFVPPLLFRAALTTSMRELRANVRPIALLAVGLVIATTIGVAAVVHRFIGMSWGPAFVLGAILSPSDAVVSISLARMLRVPRRALTIVEGETLLNDTTAFIVYRRAVAATVTGTFSLALAVPQFLVVAAGGAVMGFLVYRSVRWIRQHLHDYVLENVVFLLAPFLAYLPAEALHVSGVFSVVVAGLFLRRSSPLLVGARTRIQANLSYDLVEFMLNSLVFVLIGMQVGRILRDPAGPPLSMLLRSTAIITATVIAVRFVWTYPGAFLPYLSKHIRSREKMPTVAGVALLSWMGMRGGDSLVTALAVPHTVGSGAPFPNRELIIAVSFGVIVATMLAQGLTLAPLIRLLRLPVDRSHEKEEDLARREMIAAGDARLESLERDGLPPHIAQRVRAGHTHRSALDLALAGAAGRANRGDYLVQKRAEEELLKARREAVVRLRNEQVIDDEVLRHLEQELDLEEMRLALSLRHSADR